MLNENGGSRTDTVIKLVLILFISLLSFSVGTFVGKQVSDSDHRRAQLEGEFSDVAQTENDMGSDISMAGDTSSGKLSDDEIASLTEEFLSSESPEEVAVDRTVASAPDAHEEEAAAPAGGYKKYSGSPKPSEPKPEPAPSTTPAPEAKANVSPTPAPTPHKAAAQPHSPSPQSMRVAQGHAPAPEVKEPRKPMSVLPSVASSAIGKYTVQVASYPSENEAQVHAARLKDGGWNAFYVPAEVQGKTWYRVSVGLFTTAKSANEFKSEFLKEAKLKTAIVQKIIQ